MAFPADPAWRPHLPRRHDQHHLHHWLFDRGSLTARLQALGPFSVRVLAQGLGLPTHDEFRQFHLTRRQIVRVREVALYVRDTPQVFAHTVLPMAPRGSITRRLARLGTRSLGSMLFTHPGFSRGDISCRRVDRGHPLHGRAILALGLPPSTSLWARRSCFGFGSQRILVTEVFSPALRAIAPVTKLPQSMSHRNTAS